jgi:hypothetical protein
MATTPTGTAQQRNAKKTAPKARNPMPPSRALVKAARKAAAPGRKVVPPVSEIAAPPHKAKQKPVRDSFTMPESDFALVGHLKERALGFKRPVKKSELLRAGLHALAVLSDAELRKRLDGLLPLKAGRPKKNA